MSGFVSVYQRHTYEKECREAVNQWENDQWENELMKHVALLKIAA